MMGTSKLNHDQVLYWLSARNRCTRDWSKRAPCTNIIRYSTSWVPGIRATGIETSVLCRVLETLTCTSTVLVSIALGNSNHIPTMSVTSRPWSIVVLRSFVLITRIRVVSAKIRQPQKNWHSGILHSTSDEQREPLNKFPIYVSAARHSLRTFSSSTPTPQQGLVMTYN